MSENHSAFKQSGQIGRGAIDALAAAKAAGIRMTRIGDRISLEGRELPDDVVAELTANKPDLLRILEGREAARAALNAEPPLDCSPQRWAAARLGLQNFVVRNWGDQAILLGWSIQELYNVPELWGQIHLTGAALLLDDRKVVAITAELIATASPRGVVLKFRRQESTSAEAPVYLFNFVQSGQHSKRDKFSLICQ